MSPNNSGAPDCSQEEGDEEIKMSPYFPRGSQVVEDIKASPKKMIKSHKNHIVMGSGSKALKNYNSRQRSKLKQAMGGAGSSG